jgi:polysulfide reductase chain C
MGYEDQLSREKSMSSKNHQNGRYDISGLTRVSHSQKEWEWPVAVYLFMAGMGAGAFASGLLTEWILRPDIPSKGMLLWGPILVALGAPFLILDLGKKQRFINASFNPRTSWAARGFVILSSLIVIGIIAFTLAFLPDLLPLLSMSVPSWIAERNTLLTIFQAITLVLSFGTAAYTGLFLKSVTYVSLWNSRILPVLFLVSALSTGTMVLIVFLLGFGLFGNNEQVLILSRNLIPAELILIAFESVVLAWWLYRLKNTGKITADLMQRLLRKSYPSLIVGFVLAGTAWLGSFNITTAFFSLFSIALLISGISVLVGGFLLRFDVVKAGIRDQHPMHKMVAMQYDWRALGTPVVSQPMTGSEPETAVRKPAAVPGQFLGNPVFELAFSIYHPKTGEESPPKTQILAGLYRSLRRPVRLQLIHEP